MSRELSVPSLHINGTGFEMLKNQYKNAYTAVSAASLALRETMPHRRDFYVQENAEHAYVMARQQHVQRLAKLESIMEELEELVGELYNQRDKQKGR